MKLPVLQRIEIDPQFADFANLLTSKDRYDEIITADTEKLEESLSPIIS